MNRRKIKASGYSSGGASLEKNTIKTWQPKHYSAKSDIDLNLRILRDRAADLAINSPIGTAAIQTQTTGVLGSGLRVFPKLKAQELGLTEAQARAWSQRTKLEFELWANSLNCDYYGRNNFYELQRINFMGYLTDGDSFVLFKRRYPTLENPYTLRLQTIEAQRVSNPLTSGELSINQIEMQSGKNRIINGIEIDKTGKIVAIWISNRIWNEPLNFSEETKWRRVRFFGKSTGCRNVLHICFDTRSEMYRGAPYLSPVIEYLKMVSRYGDAELASAIIKSYFSIFFVQPATNFDFNDILPEDKNAPVVDVAEFRLGNGTLSALPRGVDVKAIDKQSAQSTFEQFTTAFIRQISTALGLPEQILMKRLDASYSASRAAFLLAEETFKERRQAFIADFCEPVYEMFLIEAIATGRIRAPGFFEDPIKRLCWLKADWRREQNHQLDITKEVTGSIMKIKAGLSTYERETAFLTGGDFIDNVTTLAHEKEMLKGLIADE